MADTELAVITHSQNQQTESGEDNGNIFLVVGDRRVRTST